MSYVADLFYICCFVGAYRAVSRLRNRPSFVDGIDLEEKNTHVICDRNGNGSTVLCPSEPKNLDSLIIEYNEFHKKWIEKVKLSTRT